MKNLINKGFKYFVAVMMVFSLMSMKAWANGSENSIPSETGSTTTENKETTKDTGDSQGDTADQLISNEEKKTNTSQESADKEGQTDQAIDKKTDYTYEDKKISVKAVLANASAISDQAELKVKEIPESTTEYKKYQEALHKKGKFSGNVLLYDISFILDGKEVEPTDGQVKISMSFKDQQLSDDLNVKSANDLKVIHFKDNDVNKQESLDATTNIRKGITTFDTESFSTYALADNTRDWVTSVNTYKKVNGKNESTPSQNFKDGDEVGFELSYLIPAESFKATDSPKEVTYQMPNGIKVTSQQEGIIKNKSDPAHPFGKYTISTSGLVTITFNDNFDSNADFNGIVKFDGKMDKSQAGDNGKVNFPGTGTSITITDNKPSESSSDIKVDKTGEFSKDKTSINYTVTVSTIKGTADTVNIKDEVGWFQNVDLSYSNMQLEKVDAYDHKSAISYNATYGKKENDGNKPYFEIKDLPKLNAGEKYVLTYQMDLTDQEKSNGDVYVDNNVSAYSKNDHVYASKQMHYDSMINKYGYISGDDTIQWVVSLNYDHRDLKKINMYSMMSYLKA